MDFYGTIFCSKAAGLNLRVHDVPPCRCPFAGRYLLTVKWVLYNRELITRTKCDLREILCRVHIQLVFTPQATHDTFMCGAWCIGSWAKTTRTGSLDLIYRVSCLDLYQRNRQQGLVYEARLSFAPHRLIVRLVGAAEQTPDDGWYASLCPEAATAAVSRSVAWERRLQCRGEPLMDDQYIILCGGQ